MDVASYVQKYLGVRRSKHPWGKGCARVKLAQKTCSTRLPQSCQLLHEICHLHKIDHWNKGNTVVWTRRVEAETFILFRVGFMKERQSRDLMWSGVGSVLTPPIWYDFVGHSHTISDVVNKRPTASQLVLSFPSICIRFLSLYCSENALLNGRGTFFAVQGFVLAQNRGPDITGRSCLFLERFWCVTYYAYWSEFIFYMPCSRMDQVASDRLESRLRQNGHCQTENAFPVRDKDNRRVHTGWKFVLVPLVICYSYMVRCDNSFST